MSNKKLESIALKSRAVRVLSLSLSFSLSFSLSLFLVSQWTQGLKKRS